MISKIFFDTMKCNSDFIIGNKCRINLPHFSHNTVTTKLFVKVEVERSIVTKMKATGIVRRIDDLGRVVVPKEIRRTLRIREGDPLEIFTDREGEIILKKYSPIGELGVFAKQYADSMAQTCGMVVAIADRDQFIAVAGTSKRDLLAKSVSKELENLMTERETVVASKGERTYISISLDEEDYEQQVIAPIISEGDVIGAVLILSRDTKQKLGDLELKLAVTAASFLGRQMES